MKAPVLNLASPARIEVEVELATPQFGGGAQARIVDRRHWLRPAALRGAMRFWWRFEANHTTPEALHSAEKAVFGAAARDAKTTRPGVFSISVVCAEPPATSLKTYEVKFGDAVNVAYFAAAPMGHDAAMLLQKGATAVVCLTRSRDGRDAGFDAAANEAAWKSATRALALALLFGGSGARTRRGAGALVVRNADDARKIGLPWSLNELDGLLKGLGASRSGDKSWFSRDQVEGVFGTQHFKTPEEAHRALMEVWREFRQERAHPKNWHGKDDWGQSHWPEGDALRLLTGRHAKWDRVAHQPKSENRGRAPRAHLGLPIVIKFKDDKLKRHEVRGDMRETDPPQPTELNGAHDKGKGRYASPVWMSVTRLQEGYVGLVLVTASRLHGRVVTPHGPLEPGPWNDVSTKLRTLLVRKLITIV